MTLINSINITDRPEQTDSEKLFESNQLTSVTLIIKFYPSSDLAKINKTFNKNINTLKIDELLKLKEYFQQPIEIKNPKARQIIKKIQKLLEGPFNNIEDNARINKIATKIFTILKTELKKLKISPKNSFSHKKLNIFLKTMNDIDKELRKKFAKNSFSHEKFIKMFEKINQECLDLRKKNLLKHLSIIFIAFFSIMIITCFIVTLVFLIKSGILASNIAKEKQLIFDDIANKTLIEYLENTDIEEILSHCKNEKSKELLKYLIEHLDDTKEFFNISYGWQIRFKGIGHSETFITLPIHSIEEIVLNLYKNNNQVQILTKLQNKIWASFFLKEFLPSTLTFLISLIIIIALIIMLFDAVSSKSDLKEQNPDIPRYLNY